MGIGSGTAALIAGLAGVGGSVASGAIGANAAGNAASEQSQAAEQAAQLQYKASQNALGFQEGEYANSQAELAPFLQSGTEATSQLDYLLGLQNPGSMGQNAASQLGQGQYSGTQAPGGSTLPGGPLNATGGPQQGIRPNAMVAGPNGASGAQPAVGPGGGLQEYTPGQTGTGTPGLPGPVSTAASPNTALGGFGSLMQPYGQTFSAPTAAQMQANDPGYQAREQLGQQALQQSAAAQGNLLTGGTAEALNQFAQNYASNEYNNYYNQSYNTYAQNYNQYEQQQTNQYNRLASLAGVGQQTAGQLGTLGQNASNSITSNLLGTAGAIGQQYNNAAAANASGIVGSANAWGGALGNSTNNLSQLALLSQLGGPSQSELDNAAAQGAAEGWG